MELDSYTVSDMNMVLVSEDYMEFLLEEEGFVLSEDGDLDSTLTCEYAIGLGFKQLGDFGGGFVFLHNLDEIKELRNKYFN